MKVLTEKQQLAKIKDELFEAMQLHQHELNKLEDKARDWEDSFWSSRRDKARLLKYDIKQLKKIREFLSDYYSCVSERYDAIVNQENTLKSLPVQ